MAKKEAQESLSESLEKLEEIVGWFDAQDSVQVEAGLEKGLQGATLIKELRGQLKEVENEFQELKKDLADQEAT